MAKIVVGIFKEEKTAKKGIKKLIEYGFRNDEISFLTKNGEDVWPHFQGRNDVLKIDVHALSKNNVLIAVSTPNFQEKEVKKIIIDSGAIRTRSHTSGDDLEDHPRVKYYSPYKTGLSGLKGGRVVNDKYDDEF